MKIPKINAYLTYITGFIYGLSYVYGDFSQKGYFPNTWLAQVNEGLMLMIFMPFILRMNQQFLHDRVVSPLMQGQQYQAFYRFEAWTYALFFLSNTNLTGIRPTLALTFSLFFILILLQAGLFLFSLKKEQREPLLASEKYIAVLFLVSGFSALIYQVVWQRVLFTTFGINSEAVTVIVSVFMFGLGIGALAGGYLQKRFSAYLLPIFVGLEILIGVFGIFSLDLIHFIGRYSNENSTPELVAWTYLILAFPTLLMGATLPILVAFLQKFFQNIGKTVGLLYAFNTIGSAIAAFCTVEILFVFTGQSTTILVAAACNLATAFFIFDASRRLRAAPAIIESTESSESPVNPQPKNTPNALTPLPYPFVFISLMAIGYISLSQEIIWYRLLGFLTGGQPKVFGLLLTAFLIGIAIGSLRSKRICEGQQDPYGYIVKALGLAVIIFYLAVPSIALITGLLGKSAGPILGYFLIAILAYYTGGMLPILVHIGVGRETKDAALPMSWLYFANIIGATCGPMLTGFILLDYFSMEGNVVILSCITILLLLLVLIFIPKPIAYKLKVGSLALALSLSGLGLHDILFTSHLERLQFGELNKPAFKHKVENRAGIITVEKGPSDIIYGGGIYDGRFNIDPRIDSNGVGRAYMIAGLHRNPEKILEIGLSSGSWAKILLDYTAMKSMAVVEINPGYRDVIKHYPEISPILSSPKITQFDDDGRRWLRSHPNEKFDFILMNTTYYWRSNATNLLSREFLELTKKHLNTGGVVYYNTTGSSDVVFTAASVFKYVTQYSNFVAASDAPFDMTPAEKQRNLLKFVQSDGTPLFQKNAQYLDIMHNLANYRFIELQDTIKKKVSHRRDLQIITDDNMAVEYKVD